MSFHESTSTYYPHNFAAEMDVLSAFVKDTSLNLVFGVDEKHFYDTRNKRIFFSIRNLATQNESVTPADIIDNLKGVKEIDKAGGEGYITDICNRRVADQALLERIKSIQDFRARRATISFGLDVVARASAESTSESLIGFVNAALGKVFTETAELEIPVGDKAYEIFMANMKAYQTGGNVVKCVEFGVGPIDRFFQNQVSVKSNYIVLGATPSTGKTALAGLMFFWNLVKKGYKVFFASQEMSAEEIINRIVANVASQPLSYVNTGRFTGKESVEVAKTYAYVRDMINQHGEIYDNSSMTIESIRAKTLAFQRKQKRVDLVLADYIQSIDSDLKRGSTEYDRINHISRSFKGLGKDLNCIVVALSQITLENGVLEPEMKHLRGSKNIAQDADIVMLLSVAESHREDLGYDIIKVNFAKGRSIGTGSVNVKFTPRFMRFGEVSSYTEHLDEDPMEVFEDNK